MNGDLETPGVPCSMQGCLICILFDTVFFLIVAVIVSWILK